VEYTVNVFKDSQKFEYKAAKDTNLMELLKINNHGIDSFCNGQGTCGKCKVRLNGKRISQPTAEEIKFLGIKAIHSGERLACMVSIESDVDVNLDTDIFQAKIVALGKQKDMKLSPDIFKQHIELSKPCLNDQRSDAKRLKDELSASSKPLSLSVLRQLPDILRSNEFSVTVITDASAVIGVESGDTTKRLFGIAADIGTTTIAAYLLDLNTGERVATYSFLNPQKKFGADVISRIKHTMDEALGLFGLHSLIISAINEGISIMTDTAGIKSNDIYKIVFTGNTAMMHFLLAICAKNLALAPFIPAMDDKIKISAKDIGININTNGIALILPSVSAYVGADTLCAVIASGMDELKSISLLIDFGTNGEIVLGNNEWLLACSTAAGPAFEAANIRCGIGGVSGAIDRYVIDGTISYTTINDQKAIGICGTGLVDIISELLRIGIIDETGRMRGSIDVSCQASVVSFQGTCDRGTGLVSHGCDTNPVPLSPINRLTTIDNQPAFIVVYAEETHYNEDIVITQKDVRELQNAKAAIAAGIQVLIARAGINVDNVSKVYLAGGFGSLINPKSALNIGLLPAELKSRIEPIGNAAGMGAQMSLLSAQALLDIEKIKEKMKYVELSSDKSFSDFYIDSMFFPD